MRIQPFSFLLGIGAAVMIPLFSKVFRPLAVEAMAAGLGFVEEGRRILAEPIVDAIVEQAGVDLAPVPDASATPGNGSPVAAALVQTVSGMDRRLGRASGGVFTLGVLLPLALTLWAIRDLTRGPIRSLPWSTALWYAHGLFRDYNIHGRD